MCSYCLRTWRPINKTPYVLFYCLSFKIILCMFVLCGPMLLPLHLCKTTDGNNWWYLIYRVLITNFVTLKSPAQTWRTQQMRISCSVVVIYPSKPLKMSLHFMFATSIVSWWNFQKSKQLVMLTTLNYWYSISAVKAKHSWHYMVYMY